METRKINRAKADTSYYVEKDLEWEASLTPEEREAVDADWEAFMKELEASAEEK